MNHLLTTDNPFDFSVYSKNENKNISVTIIPDDQDVCIKVFENDVQVEEWAKLNNDQKSFLYIESFVALCSDRIVVECEEV